MSKEFKKGWAEPFNTKVDDDKLYLLDVKDFATLVEGGWEVSEKRRHLDC